MKKRKLLFVFLVIIVQLSLSSCMGSFEYALKYDKKEVDKIYIVYCENNNAVIEKDLFAIYSQEKHEEILNLIYSEFGTTQLYRNMLDIGYLKKEERQYFLPGYAVFIHYRNNEGEIISATGTYTASFNDENNLTIKQNNPYYFDNVYELIQKLLSVN